MYYSQEQIDRANAVNLEEFLRRKGEVLTRSGNESRWKAHDSVDFSAFPSTVGQTDPLSVLIENILFFRLGHPVSLFI